MTHNIRNILTTLTLAATLTQPAWAGGTHGGGHHHDAPAANHHSAGGHHGAQGGHGASAVGGPGSAQTVTRVLKVDLLDSMRFAFDQPLDLNRGDVIRFEVTNKGRIRHEFSIGSRPEQDAHREAMRQMPGMMHDDPNAVTVEPGQTKTLIWRFDGNDDVVFACNIPGHSEAGMVATASLK